MNAQTETFIDFLIAACIGFGLSIIAYNLIDDKYYLERILRRFKK